MSLFLYAFWDKKKKKKSQKIFIWFGNDRVKVSEIYLLRHDECLQKMWKSIKELEIWLWGKKREIQITKCTVLVFMVVPHNTEKLFCASTSVKKRNVTESGWFINHSTCFFKLYHTTLSKHRNVGVKAEHLVINKKQQKKTGYFAIVPLYKSELCSQKDTVHFVLCTKCWWNIKISQLNTWIKPFLSKYDTCQHPSNLILCCS